MCNQLEEADAGFEVVCEEFCVVVFMDVCRVISSSYMQVPAMFPPAVVFIFRCLCAKKTKKNKNKLFTAILIVENLLSASYTCAIFFFLENKKNCDAVLGFLMASN